MLKKVGLIHNAFKKLAIQLDLDINEGFLTDEKVDLMDLNLNVDIQYNKNEDIIKKTGSKYKRIFNWWKSGHYGSQSECLIFNIKKMNTVSKSFNFCL